MTYNGLMLKKIDAEQITENKKNKRPYLGHNYPRDNIFNNIS